MNDCAFNNGKKCSALTKKQCKGCRFKKTTEELNEGRQKAKERIRKLPLDIRLHITRKYYVQGDNDT